MTALDVLQALPGLIWAGLAVFLVLRFQRPFREDILPRLSGVKVMGVQFDLKSDEVQKAVEAVSREGVTYPRDVGAALVSRAERSAPALHDKSILWIDDQPLNNLVERRLLARLGLFVETTTSTADAVSVLSLAHKRSVDFDVVVSDLSRPDDPVTGKLMQDRLAASGFSGPVIYYIGRVDPARPNPPGAFGLTDRPDELLHLVIDALERRAQLM